MTTKFYKHNRRVICYIKVTDTKIWVCTGKPSDASCLSWIYKLDEMDKAEATAKEFVKNYTSIF